MIGYMLSLLMGVAAGVAYGSSRFAPQPRR